MKCKQNILQTEKKVKEVFKILRLIVSQKKKENVQREICGFVLELC